MMMMSGELISYHRHGLVVETRLNVLAEEKGEGDDAMTFCCD